jgi:hypothetical protein
VATARDPETKCGCDEHSRLGQVPGLAALFGHQGYGVAVSDAPQDPFESADTGLSAEIAEGRLLWRQLVAEPERPFDHLRNALRALEPDELRRVLLNCTYREIVGDPDDEVAS